MRADLLAKDFVLDDHGAECVGCAELQIGIRVVSGGAAEVGGGFRRCGLVARGCVWRVAGAGQLPRLPG